MFLVFNVLYHKLQNQQNEIFDTHVQPFFFQRKIQSIPYYSSSRTACLMWTTNAKKKTCRQWYPYVDFAEISSDEQSLRYDGLKPTSFKCVPAVLVLISCDLCPQVSFLHFPQNCSDPTLYFFSQPFMTKLENTTHTQTHTHTHTHTHSCTHKHTHTLTHSLTHSLAHAHSLTHSLTHTHTHTHMHTHTHTHTHTNSLTCSCTLTNSPTHSHTYTHTHTHTHTHTLTPSLTHLLRHTH